MNAPRKFDLLQLIMDFHRGREEGHLVFNFNEQMLKKNQLATPNLEHSLSMQSPLQSSSQQELEPAANKNFISQEVLDCLYNKIKLNFDFFMKNLQKSVRRFDVIESKRRELTRIMLFRMSEEPLRSLRFRNQVPQKESKFIKTSQIFGSVFSNSGPRVSEPSLGEDTEFSEETSSDLSLCYEINKHMYGYLFSVMRADPCVLLRLFQANRMLKGKRIFSVRQQVSFVLELFSPDFSSQICLVFYSKLVNLFLETLFARKNQDFFQLMTKIDFSITSTKKFYQQVLLNAGRPHQKSPRSSSSS